MARREISFLSLLPSMPYLRRGLTQPRNAGAGTSRHQTLQGLVGHTGVPRWSEECDSHSAVFWKESKQTHIKFTGHFCTTWRGVKPAVFGPCNGTMPHYKRSVLRAPSVEAILASSSAPPLLLSPPLPLPAHRQLTNDRRFGRLGGGFLEAS